MGHSLSPGTSGSGIIDDEWHALKAGTLTPIGDNGKNWCKFYLSFNKVYGMFPLGLCLGMYLRPSVGFLSHLFIHGVLYSDILRYAAPLRKGVLFREHIFREGCFPSRQDSVEHWFNLMRFPWEVRGESIVGVLGSIPAVISIIKGRWRMTNLTLSYDHGERPSKPV